MKTNGVLTAMFNIKNKDIKRFSEALNKRGLVSWHNLGVLFDDIPPSYQNARTTSQHMRAKTSFPSLSINMEHGEMPSLSREVSVCL